MSRIPWIAASHSSLPEGGVGCWSAKSLIQRLRSVALATRHWGSRCEAPAARRSPDHRANIHVGPNGGEPDSSPGLVLETARWIAARCLNELIETATSIRDGEIHLVEYLRFLVSHTSRGEPVAESTTPVTSPVWSGGCSR